MGAIRHAIRYPTGTGPPPTGHFFGLTTTPPSFGDTATKVFGQT